MLYECLLLFDIQKRGLRSFVGHRPHVSTFCLCDATQCSPPFQHNESYQKLGCENGRDTRLSCCSCPPQKCISGTALIKSETMCCLPTLTLTVTNDSTTSISPALWYHKCYDFSLCDEGRSLLLICMCIAVFSFILLSYLICIGN